VRRTSFEDLNCSIAQCLEVVGEWWSPLILRDVMLGVSRFDELQARLGISRNILNQRLGHLVASGVLERVAYQDHPPRYDYRLTEKGRDLWTVLTAMRQWGDKWAAPDGPPVEAIHRPCGHKTQAILTCSACGDPLRPTDLEPVLGPGATDPGFVPPAERRGLPRLRS
jgi:DNA-binding HxlR family transcriptional regulator